MYASPANNISHVGAASLVEAFKEMHNLKILDLACTFVIVGALSTPTQWRLYAHSYAYTLVTPA